MPVPTESKSIKAILGGKSMKLKKLKEKRGTLIEEMRSLNEERSFDKFKEKEVELKNLDDEIYAEERMLELTETKKVKKDIETRDYNAEIRSAIEDEKELDITNFEIRAMGVGEIQGDVTHTSKNIKKMTFATNIIKKAEEVSELYKYVRHEKMPSNMHQIPVQKNKIGRFTNVKELEKYTEQNMDHEPVQMSAHKYGVISVFSEESLEDTGYDLMSELREQFSEAAAETLDYLLVKGDTVTKVEGLESLEEDEVAGVITTEEVGKVQFKELQSLYNTLPRKYQKNATWVIGTELAGQLSMETDGFGRPLLTPDFSQTPFGGKRVPMLLGCPVVISDHVAGITGGESGAKVAYLGDLSKAFISGIRKSFTIKSSTEYEFVKDGIAVKANMRLDIKKGLTEAMVYLKLQ